MRKQLKMIYMNSLIDYLILAFQTVNDNIAYFKNRIEDFENIFRDIIKKHNENERRIETLEQKLNKMV